MAEEIERIYVIPLKKYGYNSAKSAPTAVKRVKDYLTRHMKVEKKDIWIDDSLNNALWAHGKYKMPSKIRVKAIKFDDGVVEAYIPELELKKSRRELLKEEKAKKEPILRREEVAPEEGETGAEEYDIAPTADGEVKIKKKKAPKKKKEEEPKDTKVKEKPKKEAKPKTTKKKEKPKSEPKEKKEIKSKTAKKKSSSKKSKK
jgi:large subunit ribosomal protein L31e